MQSERWKSIMHTNKPQLRVVSAIICFIAVALLTACSGGNEFKDPSTLCDTSGKEETGSANLQESEGDVLWVHDEYQDLFQRQPNYNWTAVGNLWEERGKRSDTWGIIVQVTKKVEQGTLPVEDRIPDCLDGVPVQILEEEPFTTEAGRRTNGND